MSMSRTEGLGEVLCECKFRGVNLGTFALELN